MKDPIRTSTNHTEITKNPQVDQSRARESSSQECSDTLWGLVVKSHEILDGFVMVLVDQVNFKL